MICYGKKKYCRFSLVAITLLKIYITLVDENIASVGQLDQQNNICLLTNIHSRWSTTTVNDLPLISS